MSFSKLSLYKNSSEFLLSSSFTNETNVDAFVFCLHNNVAFWIITDSLAKYTFNLFNVSFTIRVCKLQLNQTLQEVNKTPSVSRYVSKRRHLSSLMILFLFTDFLLLKMASSISRLAMVFLGMFWWILFVHAGILASAAILQRSNTGTKRIYMLLRVFGRFFPPIINAALCIIGGIKK